MKKRKVNIGGINRNYPGDNCKYLIRPSEDKPKDKDIIQKSENIYWLFEQYVKPRKKPGISRVVSYWFIENDLYRLSFLSFEKNLVPSIYIKP